ncbi:MAG TPA: PD-(D/E)XK nuclease family protein [Solirubrobacteraceae bacterium]|nr:PD-(D/E)XK nuclease family protein [Solirubrobacteraceae bacterium]
MPSSLDDQQDVPWLESPADTANRAPGQQSTPHPIERLPREDRGERAARRAQLLQRAEVRDVLAWMRLLVDPRDAAAAVRALARPPIELRQVDLARVIQIVRRQRLDVVAALATAMESPQLPPEARERVGRFLELHRWAAGGLDTVRADLFVGRLIERLGLRRRQLLAADGEDAQRLAGLAGLCELAEEFVGSSPRPTARALAIHLTAASEQGRQEEAASAAKRRDEPPAAPAGPEAAEETLQTTLRMMREEVLGDVARIAGRLGELRLDTELDVSHGVVRYLELLKLAALAERPAGEVADAALQDVNARLRAAMTPLQREIYESSPLDELLREEPSGADPRGGEQGERRGRNARAAAVAARDEPTLEAFLPRKGDGLVLSASDVETYRGCPLRYKFARVLKIPTEQTIHQRFGIVVHQVLERFHASADTEGRGGERDGELETGDGTRGTGDGELETSGGAQETRDGAQGTGNGRQGTLAELLGLLDVAWQRSGMGNGAQERELRQKAQRALTRYHERLREEPAQPKWFERPFAFDLGPHHVRGRVDRVDRLPEGGWELIDYKTGYAKTAEELGGDIQLSLYAIAAREAWGLTDTRQAYYYVLDDRKVPVPADAGTGEWVRQAVLDAGAGILAQDFEPTPSPTACAHCDYRIVCPAAER